MNEKDKIKLKDINALIVKAHLEYENKLLAIYYKIANLLKENIGQNERRYK